MLTGGNGSQRTPHTFQTVKVMLHKARSHLVGVFILFKRDRSGYFAGILHLTQPEMNTTSDNQLTEFVVNFMLMTPLINVGLFHME